MNTTWKKSCISPLWWRIQATWLALFLAYKIISPGGGGKGNTGKVGLTKQWKWSNCLRVQNFTPFVAFFLSVWGAPVSQLIIRHSQGVAKCSKVSRAWISITDQLWLLSQLPGNVWMFILRSVHRVASEAKDACALHFPEQVELRLSIFILRLCSPF